jgi:hypothetical protein
MMSFLPVVHDVLGGAMAAAVAAAGGAVTAPRELVAGAEAAGGVVSAPHELAAAAADPAGGAALDQVAIATGGAAFALGALFWLIARYRAGRARRFERLVAFSERVSGLPGWAAIPTAASALALVTALIGMYWDISLHVDQGRDAGPLANPAHYLILAGLFGVFAAGVLAMAMPRDTPGAAAVSVGWGWRAPVGGLLMAACGAFALAGFPLDDVWHRLFGQDVTLWGPTHLMLIGGAGMTLIGQAVLLQEGIRARRPRSRRGVFARYSMLRQVALIGGLLIGLSTFQAEFDFGIPQFRAVLQPALIALAAGVALVAARVWIGRGGALGAALFFLAVRGIVSLLVGPILGETTPSPPLYLAEALVVEAAAVALTRHGPLASGALGGLGAGTIGFAAEWGWTHVAFRLPWEPALLPEGPILAAVAGTAGGVLGALAGMALRGELPRPAVARSAAAVASLALVAVLADGLYETAPPPLRAMLTVTPADDQGSGRAGPAGAAADDRGPRRAGAPADGRAPVTARRVDVSARLHPAATADDAAWLQVTVWQGGGLVVDRLAPDGAGGWRTTRPIPVDGDWKAQLRLQTGRHVLGVPVRLPADDAIPAPAVPPTSGERAFVPDRTLLQRERKGDVPGWLWGTASAVVLALAAAFLGALAWGLGRVGRRERGPVPPSPAPRTAPESTGAGVPV